MATRGLLKVQPDSLKEYEQLINSYMYLRIPTCICNTFTPQIKGICGDLNVMYLIPQLSRCVTTSLVCYNFHWNVLQLPLECATTSHRNTYNYATTSNGMLQKYQGALIQIPKTPASYKAKHININCGFELMY